MQWKYWHVEFKESNTYKIFLKEPLPLYFSESQKFIIFFRKSIIPIFPNIMMFRDRNAVAEYFFLHHKKIITFQYDIELNFTDHVFPYPFTGIVEDDFTKGFTFKFKKKGDLNKLLKSLENKYERLLKHTSIA